MKKVFLFLLAALPFLAAFSQQEKKTVLRLNALPQNGLVLDQAWTFHPADDRRYAFYAFEGEDGIPVNPALLLDRLPPVKKAGIGWFRLRLQVDSPLREQTIGLMLSLFGAAEIYLNGREVYRFGRVSGDYQTEKTQAIYARALSLKLGKEEKQLLAVRFSHHPNNLTIKTGVIPFCLRLTLYPVNKAIDRYAILVKRAYRFLGISLTIELASALITLFFFFSFPARKEYLYFGLYFSLNFVAILVQSVLTAVSKANYISVNQMTAIQLIGYILLIVASLYHLRAMYALLHLRPTRFYRFLFWYAIVSMALIPLLPEWGSILPSAFFPLACLELMPIYYKAARRKFRGAWILFFSIAVCFLSLLLLVKANLELEIEFVSVLTAIALLTPALGIIIFLAGDFARTSLALRQRIVEVEALSEKSLTQEHEKQEFLAAQKEKLEKEVELRTAALQKSLVELKAAQVQLVQAEKMASLGELTAGVAHEIQNPLNFINNFSELNIELANEMQEELGKMPLPAEKKILLESTAAELAQNQEKIMHHGKRADAIVKNMLQHSRKSEGNKEPTDINALVDQYLQLSYHGLRAKEKDFNTRMETCYDKSLTAVSVVQQEIGRVLLNLFNNAFYAVSEKKKSGNSSFEPLVLVTTEKAAGCVLITISDNGTGIPEKVVEKIFQPFFTTKPSGEGTGLGLSLSYDIITKSHGGKLRVKTKEGEGATFVIELPVS
jgi:two-component system, NtrC family, sensor kinase